jgi:hypothetical protein
MKVKVLNKQFNRPGIWMFEQPEFFEFEGEEVSVKWLTPNQIALSTGDPEFPFRVIEKSLIVSINNKAMKQQDSAVKTFSVKGSKGDSYTVTVGSGKMHCTCSGFQFRKSCKHVKEIDYA